MTCKRSTIIPSFLLVSIIFLFGSMSLAQNGVYASLNTIGERRLYKLPDPLSPITYWVPAETVVLLTARNINGSWYYAQIDSDIEGWLPFESLVVTQDVFALPVAHVDSDTLLQEMPFWNFGISMHSVFMQGQANGHSPNRFTRVGDSISVSKAFLQPIGYGVYELGTYDYLYPILQFFNIHDSPDQSPFLASSLTAGTGWTTRDILDEPAPYPCNPRENRLVCEYRMTKPSIALIMIGTNDLGIMTAAEYELNLSRIVETSINMGVIPVLSTIPPRQHMESREQSFNHAVIRVSEQYDAPLWNYWLALQTLPNRGMNVDGVHPSSPPDDAGTTLFKDPYLQYGYTIRNLTALQALHLLVFDVMYIDMN